MAITPSGDIAFFEQNRRSFDAINNSESSTFVDRGGLTRLTWRGMELKNETLLAGFTAQFNSALATWGRSTLGDWKVGLVVNARNQVVLYGGNYYQWSGALPHTINKTSPYSGWLTLAKMQDALLMQNNLSDLQDKAVAQANLQVYRYIGNLAGTNLNTLNKIEDIGVYYQPSASYGTIENNYPIKSAGSLLILPSAYGAIQLFTSSYSQRIFVRGTAAQAGVFNEWTELANLSGDGRLTYGGNEVLTTGNAGALNGIGSNRVRTSTTALSFVEGTTYAGTSIKAGVAGQWRCTSADSATGIYSYNFSRIS